MEILKLTNDYVICIKPVGMESENQMPEALKQQLNGEIYPLHRLDLNVGGVMIFARTKAAAKEFSRIIQEGKMIKEYVALVHGKVLESGDWTDYLFKDSRKNKVFAVKRMRKGVKEARLTFERVRYEENCSYVLIRLYTGRSHQIRVQFSSRGYPLVGDHKYGSKAPETEPRLFCSRITFSYKKETHCYQAFPDWF